MIRRRMPRVLSVAFLAGASLLGLAGPALADTGPALVKNINTSGSSSPQSLTAMGGKLYFSARGGGLGRELWKSDGTAQGTRRVKDIWPGSEGSRPFALTAVGDLLFFTAEDGVHGYELWVSDGTTAGTQRLTDVNPGMASSVDENLIGVNGLLYFFANNAANRLELWKSNGTPAGTTMVKRLFAGASLDGGELGFNSKLYFALDQCGGNVCAGLGLWRSNGTAAGTNQFLGSSEDASYPRDLTRSDGKLYWTDDDVLYRTKGTSSTTRSLGNLNPSALTNLAGTLYFGRTDSLWRSDGAPSTTVLVESLPARPNSLTAAGDLLFFVTVADTWKTLWASDGSPSDAEPLMEIDENARLDNMTNVAGTLYFFQNEGLTRSNGTVAGTEVVTASGMGEADDLVNVGGTLYFANENGTAGRELWKYVP